MTTLEQTNPHRARVTRARPGRQSLMQGRPTGRSPNLVAQRERRVRECAYLKAERRGFAPGHELEDWLEAEAEVDISSRPLPRS